jgi:hypothetical protein
MARLRRFFPWGRPNPRTGALSHPDMDTPEKALRARLPVNMGDSGGMVAIAEVHQAPDGQGSMGLVFTVRWPNGNEIFHVGIDDLARIARFP